MLLRSRWVKNADIQIVPSGFEFAQNMYLLLFGTRRSAGDWTWVAA